MAKPSKPSRRKASKRTSQTSARTRSRPASAAGMLDALDLLTEDHRKVDELFEEYEASKDDADDGTKEERVAEICLELTIHASVEEEIFYPAAREALEAEDDAETLDEAEVEHQTINLIAGCMLAALRSLLHGKIQHRLAQTRHIAPTCIAPAVIPASIAAAATARWLVI